MPVTWNPNWPLGSGIVVSVAAASGGVTAFGASIDMVLTLEATTVLVSGGTTVTVNIWRIEALSRLPLLIITVKVAVPIKFLEGLKVSNAVPAGLLYWICGCEMPRGLLD